MKLRPGLQLGQVKIRHLRLQLLQADLVRGLPHRGVEELHRAVLQLDGADADFRPLAALFLVILLFQQAGHDAQLAVGAAKRGDIAALDDNAGDIHPGGQQPEEIGRDADALGAQRVRRRPARRGLDAQLDDFDGSQAEADFADLALRPERLFDLALERLGAEIQSAGDQRDQADDDGQPNDGPALRFRCGHDRLLC